MPKISFTVSARTAKLIGQENFANAQGAVIELVKNSFDADATQCIIFFDHEKNHLYIIDNGDGMTKDIIKSCWMTIATNNKKRDHTTNRERVKSGAKGIGRFALDRLGVKTSVATFPRNTQDKIFWRVKWNKFDNEDISIDDVKARLADIKTSNLKDTLKKLFLHQDKTKKLIEKLDDDAWKNGTIIRIEYLKDEWNEESLTRLFSSLSILRPPIEQRDDFQIYMYSSEYKEFGEVKTVAYDQYDYKVKVEYLANEKREFKVTLIRNELDMKKLENEFSDVFKLDDMKEDLYILESFYKDQIEFVQSIYDLKGFKGIDQELLDGIGEFEFIYYFIKNTKANDGQNIKYPYKDIETDKRKKFLKKNVGIKIFRDGFRVRPYGEEGNDWLNLGERQSQSPSGVGQVKGGYRIRPNQVSGTINISRLKNINFEDKSGREGLQENDYFHLFKNMIIDFISIFEKDRNIIMYNLSTLANNEDEENKRKAREHLEKHNKAREEAERKAREEAKRKSQEHLAKNQRDLAERERKAQEEAERKSQEEAKEKLEENDTLFAKATETYEKELAQKDEEIRILRSLASVGLTVSSFSHEIRNLRSRLIPRNKNLVKQISKYIDPNEISGVVKEINPFHMLKINYEEDIKLKHWLDYSLNSLKRDKRERGKVNIYNYFNSFNDSWNKALEGKRIQLKINGKNNSKCAIKAFEVDLDVIFNNLVSNSVNSLQRKKTKTKQIFIDWSIKSDFVEIRFKDNGVGLSDDFKKDPYEIFNLNETSKRDKKGNITGTGLGLYLVKNIIDEYNKAEFALIENLDEGFGISFLIPLYK